MCQVPRPSAGARSPPGSVTLGIVIGHRWSSGVAAFAAEQDEPRGAVDALVDEGVPGGRCEFLAGRDLDDRERIGREPARGVERRQCRCGEPAVVGRVEERDGAAPIGARRTGCVRRKNAGVGAFAQRLDIAAQYGQGVAVAFDEDGFGSTARQRFEAVGPGAGEGVEHRVVGKGNAGGGEIAVRQDVEQRLAGAVAGRADRLARRGQEAASTMPATDDPHHPFAAPSRTARRRAIETPELSAPSIYIADEFIAGVLAGEVQPTLDPVMEQRADPSSLDPVRETNSRRASIPPRANS